MNKLTTNDLLKIEQEKTIRLCGIYGSQCSKDFWNEMAKRFNHVPEDKDSPDYILSEIQDNLGQSKYIEAIELFLKMIEEKGYEHTLNADGYPNVRNPQRGTIIDMECCSCKSKDVDFMIYDDEGAHHLKADGKIHFSYGSKDGQNVNVLKGKIETICGSCQKCEDEASLNVTFSDGQVLGEELAFNRAFGFNK